LHVVVAKGGDRVAPGTVYLAPAGLNMLLRPGHLIELTEPSVGQFHVPGVDATFHSVARVCGSRAVGVLLTGMGRDGAVGLRAMRDRGAATLGQDESTSVVYGMPAAARALDAVDRELPIGAVAASVIEAVCRGAHPGAVGGERAVNRPLDTVDFALLRDYLRRTAGLEFDEGRRTRPRCCRPRAAHCDRAARTSRRTSRPSSAREPARALRAPSVSGCSTR